MIAYYVYDFRYGIVKRLMLNIIIFYYILKRVIHLRDLKSMAEQTMRIIITYYRILLKNNHIIQSVITVHYIRIHNIILSKKFQKELKGITI